MKNKKYYYRTIFKLQDYDSRFDFVELKKKPVVGDVIKVSKMKFKVTHVNETDRILELE